MFSGMEVRYFDLLPESGWEVDLDGVQELADKNTVAMVIINPGNPCGNVYTSEHLAKASTELISHFFPTGDHFGGNFSVFDQGSVFLVGCRDREKAWHLCHCR